MSLNDSVTRYMDASADSIWSLISDIKRTGEFSPETFEAEWLGGATEPALGVLFRGHVKRNGRGPVYWTTCRITACDPGREFGFSVLGPSGTILNTWKYSLEPRGSGTEVTESYGLPVWWGTRIYWLIAGRARGRTNRRGMQTTLERIQKVVER